MLSVQKKSWESFVFPHCKTTSFYPHFTSSLIHNPLQFIHFPDPQRTAICLRASSAFGGFAREVAREPHAKGDLSARVESLLAGVTTVSYFLFTRPISLRFLNPIAVIYLRNHLTLLVLSFPLTSSFFNINFFLEQIITILCLHHQERLLNRKEKMTQQRYRCDWFFSVIS